MIELLKKDYKIIMKIGKGGMANIFLAEDRTTGKRVAIKLLTLENKEDVIAKKRFKSEIELTKRIHSKYVIRVYDFKWEDDIQYMVMEYVDGEMIKEYIQRRVRLTVDEAVEFGIQIALGLNDIHSAGMIHRDIKSTNLMVDNDSQIKIIDLGIAISDDSERLTRQNSVIGSVQYLSPELLLGAKASVKSDIYAFGVILFEMLSGRVPITGHNIQSTINKIKNTDFPKIRRIYSNVPQSIENIILKCTARHPSDRYKSMYDVYKDLKVSLDPNNMLTTPILIQGNSLVKKVSFKEKLSGKGGMLAIGILIICILIAILAAVLIGK